MKKLLACTLFLMASILLVSGSAFALNFDQDYWALTDYTTGSNGDSNFILTFENAAYESDFGLYTVNDINNPIAVTSTFKVFDKAEEPGSNGFYTQHSVYFTKESGAWFVTLDQDITTKQAFDTIFGFYFGVYTDGKYDSSLDYMWYTAWL